MYIPLNVQMYKIVLALVFRKKYVFKKNYYKLYMPLNVQMYKIVLALIYRKKYEFKKKYVEH